MSARFIDAWRGVALFCVVGLAVSSLVAGQVRTHAAPQSAGDRRIVITFDDLPYQAAGSGDYVGDGRRVTGEIIRVLSLHHAPAVGFVNEGQLHVEPEFDERTALLRQWVDAGLVLGNHTYSHADLNAVSVVQFEEDISRGDIITRRLMERRRPYQLYFRHPYTHTGDTEQKKGAIENFLAERGYKVTPHTIENADYAFNVPYVRAKRSGDGWMKGRLVDAYAEQTIAATAFAEQMARRIFGREIPQTLLVHANDITADCLEQTLTALERRGYRFISFDEAMADPAYRTRDTVVTRFGPTWLWRWSQSKGLKLDFKDEPEAAAWVMDLYREPARSCACPAGAAVCPPDLSDYCRIGCPGPAPRLVNRVAPDVGAVRAPRPSGIVVLEVAITEAGRVASACVLRGVRDDFDKAAQAAVLAWEFEPYRIPVPVPAARLAGVVMTVTVCTPDRECSAAGR